MQIDRRRFMVVLGGALVAGVAGCAPGSTSAGQGTGDSTAPGSPQPSSRGATSAAPRPTASSGAGSTSSSSSTAWPAPPADRPALPTTTGPVPVGKSITAIPIAGPYLAWTVDDGIDGSVVGAYADMAQATGNRITFFLNGSRKAWTDQAEHLRPLVASGQIQLGNHTWSHPDLRTLTTSQIQDELNRNEDFIQQTYGVSAKPFFRPPFGYINAQVRQAAAAIGYTAPTLWYGSLGDSAVLTPDEIADLGTQWFNAGRVVIAHANHPPVIDAMPRLLATIDQRALRTVTLRDVFAT